MEPVYAHIRLTNPHNRSWAPEAFNLNQYLEDEYAYLNYPKFPRSYRDPVEDIIVYHSGSQVLSYDFGTLNPVNKLISAMVVDDFPEALKWHGNVVVMSVVQGKVKNFPECMGELRRVDAAVHKWVLCFLDCISY